MLVGAALLPAVAAPGAVAAPVGQGFNVTPKDLSFILKQIKISEQHATNPARTASDPCAGLLGPGLDQIPGIGQGVELPWGLRTVDGSCNNLLPGKEYFGTAGKAFPTLVPPLKKSGESGDPDGPGPAPNGPTSYQQTSGFVIDSQPRVISNLIADQTATNPAAVEAAGAGAEVDPTTGTLSIPNVAPDVGLSAPYNSWFTLFGQFFDHGLDLTGKGGRGTVIMPLKPDDPLYVEGSNTNFMVLTRATTDANGKPINSTSSFVDQSQTYASHPSHQVFLREYANDAAGKPQSTGGLITGPGGGMANWDAVQLQARTVLGIELVDTDVFSVPLLNTDPYGKFTRGSNGYPQIVTTGGVVEGNPNAPIPTADAVKSGVAFLDDISHFAVPGPIDHDLNPATLKVPAVPDTNQGTTDDNDPATYDDEMLGAHFIAGDGRVNENIGLTAVHSIFHAEHNRLLDETDAGTADDDPSDLKTVIRDYAASGATNPLFTLADWQRPDGEWDGERLFQAAKFVTEMQYQHLAFEEFARKVQPMINLFGEGGTGYNTSINPSIRGEFANAVYRFGHSMLTETVDLVGTGTNPPRSKMPLLQAFLNPPAFMTGTQTPEQAAGNIVRGMTRQVGNEIDEFVTDALRNELLGLPLDLPALNMARARETGTPTLNSARRAFYAASNNSALAPYESWADFAFSIRNPGSLVNYVAAYGTHDSITGADTRAGKRNAANALLYGAAGPDGVLVNDPATTANEEADNPTGTMPTDSYDFLNSTGAYANGPGGVTTTGVDTIDLWMGGLAERQQVFGGLLGPTFNYVFEKQMEDLQNGDRFYYLSRTVSQNLLVQLEGNSFAELIQRNTDVSGLPADSFSRPDLVFDVSALGTSGPILDDPDTTEYNENLLLTRMPNGTIRYGKVPGAHVVFNGTAGNDRLWSGEGDDTVRGNDGDDRMQGGDGNDSLIGGLGDDILEDLNGDDILKGGDGNDVLSSGQGAGGDLNQGGRGNDFILGGNDITESFAGQGDDFVHAGDADDTVFGDEGNDWLEGGLGNFNLVQGDNGAPFQDDALGGHDVLIGYGGEQDYDAEGGDDIMLAGPGIQRAEGMLGFDWFTHTKDPTVAPDSDMRFTGLLPPGVETNRDRMDLVESLSGYNQNDILRGDDRDAAAMVGHELNAAGIARVDGLPGLLPAGATFFTGGNIIIGGAGSDTIEGRGGNDIIDGDAYLNVRISVPAANDASLEIASYDDMAGVQARVLSGEINPGQLRIVREIRTPGNGTSIDTAEFSGARAEYDITFGPTSVTVVHARGTQADGADTVRNAEQLRFSDQTIPAAPAATTAPGAPTAVTAAAGDASVTLSWTAPASDGGSAITGYQVDVLTGTTVQRTVSPTGTATSTVVTGLTNGTAYNFVVRAVNAVGTGAESAASNTVTPAGTVVVTPPGAPAIGVVVTRPGAPAIGTAVAGNASATVNWTAPANNGGATITEYRIQVRTGTTLVRTVTGVPGTVASSVVTGLANGTAYNFRVRAVNSAGVGALSAASNTVTPTRTVRATRAGAPGIGTAVAGVAGGAITATANWAAPASDGGSAITGYRVFALRMSSTNTVLATTRSAVRPATARSLSMALRVTGNYRFQVVAINAIGTSNRSAQSNLVAGR